MVMRRKVFHLGSKSAPEARGVEERYLPYAADTGAQRIPVCFPPPADGRDDAYAGDYRDSHGSDRSRITMSFPGRKLKLLSGMAGFSCISPNVMVVGSLLRSRSLTLRGKV